MAENDELIGIEEAARLLTLRESTIRAMVKDGRLPTIRPAGARRVRFLRSAIERLAGLRPVANQGDAEHED